MSTIVIIKKGYAVKRRLENALRRYELRYEIPSEEMQQLLLSQPERETAEIAKWMQAYCVLQRMGIK